MVRRLALISFILIPLLAAFGAKDVLQHNLALSVGALSCANSSTVDEPVGCFSCPIFYLFPLVDDRASADFGLYLLWLPELNVLDHGEKIWRDEHGCLEKVEKSLESKELYSTLEVFTPHGTYALTTEDFFVNLTSFVRRGAYFSFPVNISAVVHLNLSYRVEHTYSSWHCVVINGTKICSCSSPQTDLYTEVVHRKVSKQAFVWVEGGDVRFWLSKPPLRQYRPDLEREGELLLFSNRRLRNITVNGRAHILANISKTTFCTSSFCLENLAESRAKVAFSHSYPTMLFSSAEHFKYLYRVSFPLNTDISVKACDEFGECFIHSFHLRTIRHPSAFPPNFPFRGVSENALVAVGALAVVVIGLGKLRRLAW